MSSSASQLDFVKAHHLGNDYVYIDIVSESNRRKFASLVSATRAGNGASAAEPVDPELGVPVDGTLRQFILRLSDRRFGIGGDGVIFITTHHNQHHQLHPRRASSATVETDNVGNSHQPESSPSGAAVSATPSSSPALIRNSDNNSNDDDAAHAHVSPVLKMRMFNFDGSASPMCGNGLCCIAAIAVANGHVILHEEEGEVQCQIMTGLGKLASARVTLRKQGRGAAPMQMFVDLALSVPTFDFHAIPCDPAAAPIPEFFSTRLKSLFLIHAETPLPILFELKIAPEDEKLMQPVQELLRLSSTQEQQQQPSKKDNDDDGFSLLVNDGLVTDHDSNASSIIIAAVGMQNPHAIILLPQMQWRRQREQRRQGERSAAAPDIVASFQALEQQADYRSTVSKHLVGDSRQPVSKSIAGVSGGADDDDDIVGEEEYEQEDRRLRNIVDVFPLQHVAMSIIAKSGLFPLGVNVSVGTVSDVTRRRRRRLSTVATNAQEEQEEEEEEDVDFSISIRTWERGSGATLACGSGACATVVAAAHLLLSAKRRKKGADANNSSSESDSDAGSAPGAASSNQFDLPRARRIHARVFQPGGSCMISYGVDKHGVSSACVMRGSPTIVFRGTI